MTGPPIASNDSLDSWINSHGHILMRVTLDNGLGSVYVRSRAGVRDSIFADGFQQGTESGTRQYDPLAHAAS